MEADRYMPDSGGRIIQDLEERGNVNRARDGTPATYRGKVIEDAKTDPEAAKKLAGKRERRNQNHRQKRQALIKLAETDPEAAAQLVEIRAGEIRKQQEYLAKLQEQAKTDPKAAARWETHLEYVRDYNHNYRARKQAQAAGKELVAI